MPGKLSQPFGIGVLVLVLALFLGCRGDGDSEPDASPGVPPASSATASATPATPTLSAGQSTATATAQPPPTDTTACPDQALVCDYAFALEGAFAKRDWAAAARLFEGITYTCPKPPATPLQGIPSAEMLACEGKPEGAKVSVVISGKFASEVSVIFTDQLATELARRYDIGPRYALRAIGIPFRMECEACRRIALAAAGGDQAIMVEIEFRGPRWTGVRLLDGPTSLLIDQPDRVGAKVTTFDTSARKWSNLDAVKSNRIEYDAVVSASGDCLNLRETSSTDARVITCLPDKTPILVTEFQPAPVNGGVEWVMVHAPRLDGTRWAGWAAKQYVKPE